MLQTHLAEALHQQRSRELERSAINHRRSGAVDPPYRASRAVRVHVGWWLVSTGLRLAVWDRRQPSNRAPTELRSVRSAS